MAGTRKWSKGKRRSVASQFFLLFGGLSLEEMRRLCGNRIAKSTLKRDRDRNAMREPVSEKSAEAYAAALGHSKGFDMGTISGAGAFVEAVNAARRTFWNRQPILEHVTSASHDLPPMTRRLDQRILDRKWDSVIDIIETFRDSGQAKAYPGLAPYLDFYLGMAFRNQGDTEAAALHFRDSLVPIRDSNSDTDLKCHAALHLALALQDRPDPDQQMDEIHELLDLALNHVPTDHPETLVNALIAANRLPDNRYGMIAERIRIFIQQTNQNLDWPRLRSIFLEQKELSLFREDDTLQTVIRAIDDRIRS